MTFRTHLVIAALVAVAGPALGQVAASVTAPQLLSDPELAAVRGGIMTPAGLDIGFAANVRTYVDGQLALETRLTWTNQGPIQENAGGSAGTPAGFTGIPGLTGGVTQVLHDLQNGRIASVVINTANDRTIRQDTDVTLTLPQLPELQRQIGQNATAANLQSSLAGRLSERSGR